MRNITVVKSFSLLAFFGLALASVTTVASAGAMSDANCNACVSSYHCDSAVQSCVHDCGAKAEGADHSACDSSCGGASGKCVADAKAECKEYCSQ
ncbi:hypothetical protein [Methylocapsa palsarum]|uniref:Uncharacterized protein n=1 Tax=Methylocapsa palsarum TaxID=1612308 RepID=A0A1I3Z229_9HYPH|nr:hypothetical protein [Methylocapsa palsarum]SFK38080.1 hypothetical protein SAMN05444581_10717 [Methylocapsa palsarum]